MSAYSLSIQSSKGGSVHENTAENLQPDNLYGIDGCSGSDYRLVIDEMVW
jgi:hypothetical protein